MSHSENQGSIISRLLMGVLAVILGLIVFKLIMLFLCDGPLQRLINWLTKFVALESLKNALSEGSFILTMIFGGWMYFAPALLMFVTIGKILVLSANDSIGSVITDVFFKVSALLLVSGSYNISWGEKLFFPYSNLCHFLHENIGFYFHNGQNSMHITCLNTCLVVFCVISVINDFKERS